MLYRGQEGRQIITFGKIISPLSTSWAESLEPHEVTKASVTVKPITCPLSRDSDKVEQGDCFSGGGRGGSSTGTQSGVTLAVCVIQMWGVIIITNFNVLSLNLSLCDCFATSQHPAHWNLTPARFLPPPPQLPMLNLHIPSLRPPYPSQLLHTRHTPILPQLAAQLRSRLLALARPP
ncbi:hypothetical protein FPV67DRAFT_1764346 [Lyophyllum atratum]|nr:hypothetical protein FPV67DRAFT_1764346 [Lyophyllum atratum]